MTDWTEYLRKNLDLPAMQRNRDERAIQEMASHLEDLLRDAISRGCTEPEAEAIVIRWLGDPTKGAREIVSAEPGGFRARADRWIEKREDGLRLHGGLRGRLADGLRDVRTALRSLVRRPLFTGVVVLVLALGIGATSAIFTLVHAIILSPLPFDEADRLVAVQHTAPDEGLQDAGQCAAWHFTYAEENQVFETLGMMGGSTATITGNGSPEAIPTMEVTHGVFEALRVKPIAGRLFGAEEYDPDGRATVMLGHGYWLSRFGGDPNVLGRTLQVDGLATEIVGVMPDPIRAFGYQPAVILPLRFRRTSLFVGNIGYDAVARLRQGVTLDQAAAELNRILPMAWQKFPGGPVADSVDPAHYKAVVRPLKEDLVGSVSRLLWILLAVVGVVLLIAWANVANLFLVRAQTKEGEMAVRSALGASRGRLLWEYLKESLLLGLVGGAAGLLLGQIGLRSLLALVPTNLPRAEEVRLDATVLLTTIGISLVCGLLFGWIPVIRQGRRGTMDALKEGGRSRIQDRSSRRAQSLLVVSQMALVVVLLVACGLMVRSFLRLSRVDPGFRGPDKVLALRLYLPRDEVRTGAEVAATYEAIVRRLADLPGVDSVGLATAIPLDGSRNFNPFYVEGDVGPDAGRLSRRHKWIGGDYLETLGIPLLAGRSITWDDVHERAPVALLSESLARELFGSAEAALGRRIAARPDPPRWKEVVGVVADVHEDGMDQDPPGLVYWPYVTLGFWQGNPADQVQVWRSAGLALRSSRVGTADFQKAVEGAIWEVNRNLPLIAARPLDDLMADSMARTSFSMVLLGVAAAVGLVLGFVGVYGVISYAVAQRTGEIGMRMALGAGARQIQAMVLRQSSVLAAWGVGIGFGIAVLATPLMSALLFEVSATDPATYAGVAAGLVSVALLASYLPARRAASVDPVVALRAE